MGETGGHDSQCAKSIRDAKSLRGASKIPNNVASTFFNTVYLLPKDLRFEHGGAI